MPVCWAKVQEKNPNYLPALARFFRSSSSRSVSTTISLFLNETKQMKIYHYTKGMNIESIFHDGAIATERKRGLSRIQKNTDYVWLTESQRFPKTALPYVSTIPSSILSNHLHCKNIHVDLSGIAEASGGLYRFGFDSGDDRFKKWFYSSERKEIASLDAWNKMEKIANKVGDNVREFWISTDDIQLKNFSLESFENGKWEKLMEDAGFEDGYDEIVDMLCMRSRAVCDEYGIKLEDFRLAA